jgi:hypothetical protein
MILGKNINCELCSEKKIKEPEKEKQNKYLQV